MTLHRNYLCWPVNPKRRSFRIYVVEPESYAPEKHVAIFNAAMNRLVRSPISELTGQNPYAAAPNLDPFDLVTFPEAFLASEDLVTALRWISYLPSCGCVHVGLRPTSTSKQHLFTLCEAKTLIEKLLEIPIIEKADLSVFHDWIHKQGADGQFNIGCLFMRDPSGKLRVCLHPKVVRSKYEIGMLQEQNMAEADMLTLVSLIPQDRRFFSLTIQPLLCSDAINGQTDRPNARPLYAVNIDSGDGSDGWVPDHIDVVSLATCTPHPEYGEPASTYSQWHPAFQETFCRAAWEDDLLKHHHAVFVFSNFRIAHKDRPGGLSGAFIPVPFSSERSNVPSYLTVSVWGHPKEKKLPDEWSKPNEPLTSNVPWHNYGHIASLRATVDDISTRMVGFTVDRLPRQSSRWSTPRGLIGFQMFVATFDADNKLTFTKQD